jgi:catechol 2,3-dioxygenase-like lactoylglutathione lyase family enzyme
MTRIHIHVSVDNIRQSSKFYSALFGAEPTLQKPDYVKWLLDEPGINFAISARNSQPGLRHLGIQAENKVEMAVLRERIKEANLQTFDEGQTTCCYAKSDKSWVRDPSGIPWEAYHTTAEAAYYNEETANKEACCVPETNRKTDCCG